MSAGHPFVIDGVRHDSNCQLLYTPAFHAQRRACTCGAEQRKHDLLLDRDCALLDGTCTCHTITDCKYGTI